MIFKFLFTTIYGKAFIVMKKVPYDVIQKGEKSNQEVTKD